LTVHDEIQSCPRALLSLKAFCKESPQFHIAAAVIEFIETGSYLTVKDVLGRIQNEYVADMAK
jgi:hypothetical protein